MCGEVLFRLQRKLDQDEETPNAWVLCLAYHCYRSMCLGSFVLRCEVRVQLNCSSGVKYCDKTPRPQGCKTPIGANIG